MSDEPKYPGVEVELSGQDGNAFAIIGATRLALRRGGVPPEEISAFTKEAQSGDCGNVLQTAMKWVTMS
jgi:hypothetical protein